MSDVTHLPPVAGLPTDPAPETIMTATKRVRCDGGGGALGHPVVYYDMGEDSYVECLYCDRRFVYVPGEGSDEH